MNFQPSGSRFPIAVEAQHIGRVPRPFHPMYPEGKIENQQKPATPKISRSQDESEEGNRASDKRNNHAKSWNLDSFYGYTILYIYIYISTVHSISNSSRWFEGTRKPSEPVNSTPGIKGSNAVPQALCKALPKRREKSSAQLRLPVLAGLS